MGDYGIYHRLCSVANPHANTRVELAVKTVKRMISDCRIIGGKLDTARFSQALLQACPQLWHCLAVLCVTSCHVCQEQWLVTLWREVAGAREQALMPRARAAEKKWSTAAKKLPSLVLGDKVLIQNQSGNHPRRWDKRGEVVEVLGFDQYQVRVEGSRRLTLRNRRFLRKYSQFHPTVFVILPVNTEWEP